MAAAVLWHGLHGLLRSGVVLIYADLLVRLRRLLEMRLRGALLLAESLPVEASVVDAFLNVDLIVV